MKKIIILSTISSFLFFGVFDGVLAVHENNPYLQKSSFVAGLWSSFKGGASLIIKTIYSPFYSPPPVVKPASEQTLQGVVKSGTSPGPLYIPGKFGFGGTGGIIPSTPVPIKKSDKDAITTNIGGINPSQLNLPSYLKKDTPISPDKGKSYPTPQPPTPYPKPAMPDTTFREQIQKNLVPAVSPAAPVKTSRAGVLELAVMTTFNLLEPIKEQSQIKFFANLKLSDGSFKDVSNIAKWMVLGDIGTINTSGFFTAQLGLSVSEYGEGSGSVTATYSGAEGVFLGKSPIFKVYASEGGMNNKGDIGGQ